MEFWILALLLSQVITLVHGTACSTANLTSAPDVCIMAIRNAIEDENRFFFGSEHTAKCAKAYTMDCVSMLPPVPHSIASVLFFKNTFEVNLIKDFLEVNFTSPSGSYEGCGSVVTRNTTRTFRLDPLNEDAYPPWDARFMPEISWATKNNQLYTLIFIDVGFGYTHGIFLNINGTDLGNADVLKKYSGPLNFRRVPNPYAFILFEQSKRINISTEWMNIIKNPMLKFNVSDFQEQHELKGPIAVNWLLSSYDAYSAGRQAEMGIVNNCASLVEDRVRVFHSNRPWIKLTSPLSVNVKVNFKVNQIDFFMCCKHLKYPSKSFTLDLMSNKVLKPVETRTGQKVDLELSMSGFGNTSSMFPGKHYTMLMVDPDVPKPLVGSNSRPLLHWLVINMGVNSKGVPNGTTIHPYRGPAPPDQKPHTYYYLLYEQGGELDLKNTEDFDGQCSSSLAGKCLFDVDKFQSDLNLTLVGLSWMTAHNDYYTNYTKTTRGEEMDQFCKWTPGFKDPCTEPKDVKDGATVSHLVSLVLVVVSGVMAVLLKL